MDYYTKYIKYKTKYINFKKTILKGGYTEQNYLDGLQYLNTFGSKKIKWENWIKYETEQSYGNTTLTNRMATMNTYIEQLKARIRAAVIEKNEQREMISVGAWIKKREKETEKEENKPQKEAESDDEADTKSYNNSLRYEKDYSNSFEPDSD